MKNVSICSCTILNNEIDTITFSGEKIIQDSNFSIFIDGGPSGSSKDGTIDFLLSLQKKYGKDRVYIESGTYGKCEKNNNWDNVQRNRYLDVIKELSLNPGWIFIRDPDEHYLDEHMKTIKNATLLSKDEISILRWKIIEFFYDERHFSVARHREHRLTRYDRNLRYEDNSVVLFDKNNVPLINYPLMRQRDLGDGILTFHYNYCQPWYKILRKKFRYGHRGDDVRWGYIESLESIENDNDDRESMLCEYEIYNGVHPDSAVGYIRLASINRNLGRKEFWEKGLKW